MANKINTINVGGIIYDIEATNVSSDAVSVTRDATTGTKVCTISVNGTNYDIYAPEVTSIDDGELV